jgi:hypothetical protein
VVSSIPILILLNVLKVVELSNESRFNSIVIYNVTYSCSISIFCLAIFIWAKVCIHLSFIPVVVTVRGEEVKRASTIGIFFIIWYTCELKEIFHILFQFKISPSDVSPIVDSFQVHFWELSDTVMEKVSFLRDDLVAKVSQE